MESTKIDDNFTYKDFKTRSTIAQILLSIVRFFVNLSITLTVVYPTAALPLWLNGNDGLKIDENWAPFIVPTQFAFFSLGTICSRPFGKWGRKPVIFIALIFLEIGWLLCYLAEDIWLIIVSRVIAGIGNGISTPVYSLLGEACEPRLRGILEIVSGLAIPLAFNLMSLMMGLHSFRQIALLNSVFPIITMIYAYFIPESPLWLCTKNRYEEALKSLIWLRGWEFNDYIKLEYEKLRNYCEQNIYGTLGQLPAVLTEVNFTKKINNHDKQDIYILESKDQSKYSNTICDNMRYLFTPEMLKPTILACMVQFYNLATPNTIFLFYLPLLVLNMNEDAPVELIMIIYSASSLITHIFGVILVPYAGKRVLMLISMVGSAWACALFAVCDIFKELFDYWLLTAVLIILQFFVNMGAPNLIFPLSGELFPVRGRILGVSITVVIGTVYGCISTLIFLPLLKYTHMYTIMFTYSGFYILGFIYFQLFLIETEGKTLEQIQKEMNS